MELPFLPGNQTNIFCFKCKQLENEENLIPHVQKQLKFVYSHVSLLCSYTYIQYSQQHLMPFSREFKLDASHCKRNMTKNAECAMRFFTHQRHLLIFSTNLSMRPPMCKSPFTLILNFMDSSPSFWSTCTDSSHDVSPYSAAVIIAPFWKYRGETVTDRILLGLDITFTEAQYKEYWKEKPATNSN